MQNRLLVDNSNVVELRHLENAVTGAAVLDAVVNFTLQDEGGVDVAGAPWPLSMTLDDDNVYRVVLPLSVEIVEGEYYVGVISAFGGGSEQGRWEVGLPAVRRRRL